MPRSGTALLHRDAPMVLAFTVAEAAAALAMSRTRLYAAIRCGDIASYRVGRSRRISLHAMQDYQSRQEAAEGGEVVDGSIEDGAPQHTAPRRGRKVS